MTCGVRKNIHTVFDAAALTALDPDSPAKLLLVPLAEDCWENAPNLAKRFFRICKKLAKIVKNYKCFKKI